MAQTIRLEPLDSAAAFNTYSRRIHRYVLSLIRDPAEADDLTQETFLRAHRRRESLREAEALGTWLYRIATHVCLDRLRQRGAHTQPEPEAALEGADVVDGDSPSLQQVMEQKQMSLCVQQYLDRLADSYRAVILLHDVQGLTGPEIAHLLGESLATVKIRLHRARKKLQAALQAGCTLSRDKRDVLVCDPKR
jgi:RNA polymerase sigma-70 factor (ECF subfamily)